MGSGGHNDEAGTAMTTACHDDVAVCTSSKVPPQQEEASANDEKMMNDTTVLTLAVRQERQRQAQVANLREQGLVDDEMVSNTEEAGANIDETTTCDGDENTDSDPKQDTDSTEASSASDITQSPKQTAEDDPYAIAMNAARKAAIAAVGGTLVAVGAILAPLPTPGGILLAGAGLGVLSTEFEGAKKVLEAGKEKLVDLIDSLPPEEEELEGNKEEKEEGTKKPEEEEEGQEVALSESGGDNCLDGDASSVDAEELESCDTTSPITPPMQSPETTPTRIQKSFQTRARRIGRSIRPFLTDEDAPRRAMDEFQAKFNEMMDFSPKQQQERTEESSKSETASMVLRDDTGTLVAPSLSSVNVDVKSERNLVSSESANDERDLESSDKEAAVESNSPHTEGSTEPELSSSVVEPSSEAAVEEAGKHSAWSGYSL